MIILSGTQYLFPSKILKIKILIEIVYLNLKDSYRKRIYILTGYAKPQDTCCPTSLHCVK